METLFWHLRAPEGLGRQLKFPSGTLGNSGNFSRTLLNLTWLCTKASWNLLRNLLRNPVELDLALHQGFLEPSPEPSPEPRLPGIFSGTFSETLLNLTWLCTKASQTFFETFSGTLLNLTGLCTKALQTFFGTFGTFSRTSLNLTRGLHQCTPELFWAQDPISLRCWGIIDHNCRVCASVCAFKSTCISATCIYVFCMYRCAGYSATSFPPVAVAKSSTNPTANGFPDPPPSLELSTIVRFQETGLHQTTLPQRLSDVANWCTEISQAIKRVLKIMKPIADSW